VDPPALTHVPPHTDASRAVVAASVRLNPCPAPPLPVARRARLGPASGVQHGVKKLDLWRTGLTEPPGNLRLYPDLTVLQLASNKLTTPPDLSSLPNLERLGLDRNKLTT